jgi:hypothetical protein
MLFSLEFSPDSIQVVSKLMIGIRVRDASGKDRYIHVGDVFSWTGIILGRSWCGQTFTEIWCRSRVQFEATTLSST